MFNKDIKRIISCIEHEDYYSAMEYANFVKNNYTGQEKNYFEGIIKSVKNEGYCKI